ncbi:hypothetical protein ACPOL_2382 [Acidisarcina polymorpha]|uniref:Uncharacterized protein n=1 Tax=Acidisarcina polymorpha TaxID=2211140 RepID=A0A2Z5FYV6_9BACT|nr:hypothetical protein ACPOL_2382 [Acidisarcina polymorpha]
MQPLARIERNRESIVSLEKDGSGEGRTEGGAHADEEDGTVLFCQLTEALELRANGGIAAVRLDEVAQTPGLLAALVFEYLYTIRGQELSGGFDAVDPPGRLAMG